MHGKMENSLTDLLWASCCPDPSIVISFKLVHRFLDSLSASVSMFTINTDSCLLLFVSVSVLVSQSLQPRRQIHHRLLTFILLWSVGSMALKNINLAI